MKKSISFLLSFILIITATVVYADTYAGTTSDNSADIDASRELLASVGVIPEFSDDYTSTVARGEFLNAVIASLKLSLTDNARENFFYDVKATDVFCSAVNYALELGIISEGKYFRPYDSITYGEAAKMITVALGYDIDAKSKGGYPIGYVSVASSLGLSKGFNASSTDTLTVSECYIMLANMLEADIRVTSSIVGDNNGLSVQYRQASNILTILYGWYEINGVVTSNHITNLYDNTESMSEGYVIIGSEKYYCAKNLILGTYVEGYACNDNGKETVKYLKYDSDSILTLTDVNEPVYKDGSFKYFTDDGKEEKAVTESMLAVVYNGKACVDYTDEDFSIDVGRLVLVDSDDDSKYDVVHVYDGQIVHADIVNTDTEKIIDNYIGINISYSDTDNIRIFEDGIAVDISYLTPNAVMEYYPSKNGDYKEFNILTSAVSGKVTAKGNGIIYIDELPYRYTDYFADRYLKDLIFNTDITFLTTKDNTLVAIDDSVKSSKKLAYVYKSKLTSGISSSVMLKALTQDGNHVILTLADKVKVNANSTMSAIDIYDRYFSGNKETVIRYVADSEGIVSAVYLPQEPSASQADSVYNPDIDSKDILKPYSIDGVSDTTMVYYKIFGLFVPYFSIDNNTNIFCVDPDTSKSDEERYTVGSTNSWANDSEIAFGSIKVYNVTSSGRANVIVVSRQLNTTLSEDGAAGGVIESVSTALNAKGEESLKLSMCSGNSYFTLYIEKNHEKYAEATDVSAKTDLSIGDYIIFNKDEYNNIITYTKHFDYSEGTLNHKSATGIDNDILVYYYGILGSIEASSFSLDLLNASGATKSGKITLLMQHTNATVVDIPSGIVRGVSFGQASDYMNQGYKVLVRTRYADIYEFIIYKE